MLLFSSSLWSQNSCSVFTQEQYSDLTIVPSIQYAPNQIDFNGNSFAPFARLVKATANNCPSSPLLILVHGGGFTSGNALLMDSLSFKFAKLGYVCASISYRLGWQGAECPLDSNEAVRAWFRCIQDINSSIGFFKNNYAQYQIDTNNVFLAGWSAGGFAAIGAAYTDLPTEILSSCSDLGPISGASTLSIHFPSIKAIASFSVAFLFPQHIQNGQKPGVIMFNNAADAYQIPLQCGKWWNFGNCENSFPQACGIDSVLPVLEQNNVPLGYIVYNYQTNNQFNSHWLHNPAFFPYWEEETDSMASFFQQFITSDFTVGLRKTSTPNKFNLFIPAYTDYVLPEKIDGKIFTLTGTYIMNVYQGIISTLLPGIYLLKTNTSNIKLIVK